MDTQVATETSIHYAIEAFLFNSDLIRTAVEDFTTNFGTDDNEALREYLVDIEKNKLPAAGYEEGFEAAVTVIKANEAVLKNARIEINDELFALA